MHGDNMLCTELFESSDGCIPAGNLHQWTVQLIAVLDQHPTQLRSCSSVHDGLKTILLHRVQEANRSERVHKDRCTLQCSLIVGQLAKLTAGLWPTVCFVYCV